MLSLLVALLQSLLFFSLQSCAHSSLVFNCYWTRIDVIITVFDGVTLILAVVVVTLIVTVITVIIVVVLLVLSL